eukprot:CAMPEP_0168620582 /NCGR_PEP_ID=MMETSP0449_2-20121227/7218_1 /TAXON_ID=1082188 /ORGANISM="Strombidium rassoulzadegani, Strain ras09" /LENGTH=393 /DNA_ID=CAMNT_0008661605 /DNA_START=8 /DNA_END=1186 /DNA_ORIENTATION=+
MPTIGLQGQQKIKSAKVLLIGAGGLGSPAALYLSGAGVGTLGLVDADVVDESNLHRQVIHTEKNVGVKKVESARGQIGLFNRHTRVVAIDARLNSENAMDIIGSKEHHWDIVMDGSDNAATRYLINDACVIYNIPLVSGSALQWEGQVTVLNYLDGPCYRCLYPKPPPAEAVTNCSDGGVIGMVPGIIGNLQAIEVLKIILGVDKEDVLWRRMIFFDALSMRFRNVKLRERNASCLACGPDTPPDLKIKDTRSIDYLEFCQTKCSIYDKILLPPDNEATPSEFMEALGADFEKEKRVMLIDVRPAVQFGIVNTNQSEAISQKVTAQNVELRNLDSLSEKICSADQVFIMCRRGNASKVATQTILSDEKGIFKGFKNVKNIKGGIEKIREEVDP